MIGKRPGKKDNGNESGDLSGPPPELAETKKPRKTRKSPGAAEGQAEIDRLNSKLAASAAQIELYQFQIKNLRADLDSIKLHSVLANLGGPVVFSENRPETKHEPEPPHPLPPQTLEPASPEQTGADLSPHVETEQQETASAEPAPLEPALEGETPSAAAEDIHAAPEDEGPGAPQLHIDGIKKNFTACVETINAFSRKLDEYADEIKSKDTLIDLQRERIELEIQKAEKEFVPKSEYDTLQSQIEVFKEKISALERVISENHEIDSGVKDYLDQLERLENTLKDISDRNDALQAENKSLQGQIDAIQLEKDELQAKNNAVKSEKDALLNEKGEARAAHEAETGKLKARIQTLNDERVKSESEIVARLENENEALRNEHETLKSENDALAKCNEALKNCNEALVDEKAALGIENENLKNEKEALSLGLVEIRKGRDAEIDSLWRNIETLKAEQAAAFEETINDLTTQNRELHEKRAELEKRLLETSKYGSEEIERLKRAAEELRIEKESGERQAEERMKFHAERLEEEFTELREAMQARENELVRQEKHIEELEGDISRLNKENFDIRSMLEATRAKVVEAVEKDAGGEKKRLLEKFASGQAPSTLLELRSLFLSSRKYDDAVRTFRKLLIEPGNQKFMPAVCLLVGEFYNLAGRKEEGAFYLANPLIKDDVFAKEIIKRIQPDRH